MSEEKGQERMRESGNPNPEIVGAPYELEPTERQGWARLVERDAAGAVVAEQTVEVFSPEEAERMGLDESTEHLYVPEAVTDPFERTEPTGDDEDAPDLVAEHE